MIEKNEFLIIGKVSGGFTIEQRTSLLEDPRQDVPEVEQQPPSLLGAR